MLAQGAAAAVGWAGSGADRGEAAQKRGKGAAEKEGRREKIKSIYKNYSNSNDL